MTNSGRIYILLGFGFTVLICSDILIYRSILSASADSHINSNDNTAIDALKKEVMFLGNRIDRIEQRVSVSRKTNRYDYQPSNASEDEDQDRQNTAKSEYDEEHLLQQEKERRKQKLEYFNLQLFAEAQDEQWEDEVRAAVDKVRDQFVDSDINDISCGSTFCRMKFVHENEFERRRFLKHYLPLLGKMVANGSSFYNKDENSTTLYFAREGHKLPKVNR